MANSPEISAWTLDLWKILLMGSEVHALRRILRGDPLLAQIANLVRQIREVALKPVLAVVAAGVSFAHFREKAADEQSVFSSVSLPENREPGFLALSPDGRRLIVRFIRDGKTELYLRSLDSPKLQLMANTSGTNVRAPFWSPDGKFVGFFSPMES